jgi:hypothetical protein
MTPGELAYLNAIREGFGLPTLKPGIAKCLKCDQEFESEDVRTNRICPLCGDENRLMYGRLDPEHKLDHILGFRDIYGRTLPSPDQDHLGLKADHISRK